MKKGDWDCPLISICFNIDMHGKCKLELKFYIISKRKK